MKGIICYVKEEFFIDHKEFIKMLDPGNTKKQSQRAHVCILIEQNNKKYYVPLRNNLGDAVRKYGRIGHSLTTKKRPKAGLDFRYALIIEEDQYIEYPEEQRIPNSQYKIIKKEYDVIKSEFKVYIRGFERSVNKHREYKEPLYKESSLLNYSALFIKK